MNYFSFVCQWAKKASAVEVNKSIWYRSVKRFFFFKNYLELNFFSCYNLRFNNYVYPQLGGNYRTSPRRIFVSHGVRRLSPALQDALDAHVASLEGAQRGGGHLSTQRNLRQCQRVRFRKDQNLHTVIQNGKSQLKGDKSIMGMPSLSQFFSRNKIWSTIAK